MSGKYDDILRLSRPVSPNRAKMSNRDRAAQFSPYAALTGYDAAIRETGRLTDDRMELSENRSGELDRSFHDLLEMMEDRPRVRITRFIADLSKAGGKYVTGIYRIRKMDLYSRELWTEEGERFSMDDIWEMEIFPQY